MAHPDQRDKLLEGLILQHIEDYAESDATNRSGNGIRIAMRLLLGKVSNEKVSQVLDRLLEEGKVIELPGFRRGSVHSLPPKNER